MARDLIDALASNRPALVVSAGVRMHSWVFVRTPYSICWRGSPLVGCCEGVRAFCSFESTRNSHYASRANWRALPLVELGSTLVARAGCFVHRDFGSSPVVFGYDDEVLFEVG